MRLFLLVWLVVLTSYVVRTKVTISGFWSSDGVEFVGPTSEGSIKVIDKGKHCVLGDGKILRYFRPHQISGYTVQPPVVVEQ